MKIRGTIDSARSGSRKRLPISGGGAALAAGGLMAAILAAALLAVCCLSPLQRTAFAAASEGRGDDVSAALAASPYSRLSGSDRYETAAAVAAAFQDTGGTVVVATGENYPDALCASVLAGCCDAPILLSARDGLPESTAAQLARLAPSKAYVVGGTSAVGEAAARQISAYCATVVRIEGADRYETCAAVNREVAAMSPYSRCFLATGTGFADSLSVSAYACASKTPIFLCGAEGIPDSVVGDVLACDEVVVLGGPSAVSPDALSPLAGKGVWRLQGEDRYETSAAIARWSCGLDSSMAIQPSVALASSTAVVATGSNYPDALTGGPYAAKLGCHILLAPSSPSKAARTAARVCSSYSSFAVVGGASAVSENVAKGIAAGEEEAVKLELSGWWVTRGSSMSDYRHVSEDGSTAFRYSRGGTPNGPITFQGESGMGVVERFEKGEYSLSGGAGGYVVRLGQTTFLFLDDQPNSLLRAWGSSYGNFSNSDSLDRTTPASDLVAFASGCE